MAMARWIRADGITLEVEPTTGTFTLEELKTLVGGEIEIVPVAGEMVLVVERHGGRKGLPVNGIASALYTEFPPVLGDVVVCRANQIEKGN